MLELGWRLKTQRDFASCSESARRLLQRNCVSRTERFDDDTQPPSPALPMPSTHSSLHHHPPRTHHQLNDCIRAGVSFFCRPPLPAESFEFLAFGWVVALFVADMLACHVTSLEAEWWICAHPCGRHPFPASPCQRRWQL